MRKFLNFYNKELPRAIIGALLLAAAMVLEHLSEGAPDHTLYIVSLVIYCVALVFAGLPVFISAVRGIIRRDLLDEKFLMSIASVGAMIIGEMSEGVAVMVFFLVGEYFEHRAVQSSRKSIRALMDICPDVATVLEDGRETVVDAEDVEVGTTIVIRAGERVPLDCVVLSGSADVDTSALTGESVPRAATKDTKLESGTIILNGVLTCRTVHIQEDSAASRILSLVESANENKSKEENFITKFSRFYTPIVVGLAVLMASIPPIFKLMTLADAVHAALSFLVISCPCALVISVPLAFFGGIGAAASKGILFKGGNVFSSLSRADSYAFDKTGTLTTGKFNIAKTVPVGITENELLYYAASAEYGSNHPLALSVKAAVNSPSVPEEYTEIAGRGVNAKIDGKTVLVGSAAFLLESGIENVKADGTPALLVAIDGEYKGAIYVKDDIKPEAEAAIKSIASLGAKRLVMLSGDKRTVAESVANAVGISETYAELLPDEKYGKLREIISSSSATVYVGDGINDAPALAVADVGIAMGALGTDSAIESADLVIMSDDLSRIPTAIKISRKTLVIAKINIAFALSVKLGVMILSAIGLANMWLAVFADVGVAVLAILNSMRTLRARD